MLHIGRHWCSNNFDLIVLLIDNLLLYTIEVDVVSLLTDSSFMFSAIEYMIVFNVLHKLE